MNQYSVISRFLSLLQRVFLFIPAIGRSLFGYDFFISYAWSDSSQFPQELEKCLKERHFRVFRDKTEMHLGDPITPSILNGVKRSTALILIATPAALRSSYVQDEILTFDGLRSGLTSSLKRPLIPIEVDGCIDKLPDNSILKATLNPGKDAPIRYEILEANLKQLPSTDLLNAVSNSLGAARIEQRRKVVFSIVFLIFISLLSLLIWSLLIANERMKEYLSTAGRLAAEAIIRDIEDGSNTIAILKAKNALPDVELGTSPAFVPELEASLYRAVAGQHERHIFRHHNGRIIDAAISRDGKIVVTGGDDGLIIVWSVETGGKLFTLNCHCSAVNQVLFHPNGKYLLTAGGDGRALLWDLENGGLKKEIASKGQTGIGLIKFSDDGKLLVIGPFGAAPELWNVKDAKRLLVLEGGGEGLISTDFSPNGKFLVTITISGKIRSVQDASDEIDTYTMHVWNIENPRIPKLMTKPHPERVPISYAGFLRNGIHDISKSTLVFGTLPSMHPDEVTVWDMESNSMMYKLDSVVEGLRAAMMEPGGQFLLTIARNGQVGRWNPANGRLEDEIRLQVEGVVTDGRLLSDGRTLVIVGTDDIIRIVDLETKQQSAKLAGHESRDPLFRNMKWFIQSDLLGKTFISLLDDGSARLWNSSPLQLIAQSRDIASRFTSVSFTSDDRSILASARQQWTRVFDAETGRLKHTLKGHAQRIAPLPHVNYNKTVYNSPDGLVTIDQEFGPPWGPVRVLDARTGKTILSENVHLLSINSIDFCEPRKRFATGGVDGSALVWNWDPPVIEAHYPHKEIGFATEVALSDDCELLATAMSDNRIRVYRIEQGDENPLPFILLPCDQPFDKHAAVAGPQVQSLTFPPTSNELAVLLVNGNLIMLDIASCHPFYEIIGPAGEPKIALFNADGMFLAVASNKNVNLYDASTGLLLAGMNHSGEEVTGISFNHAGTKLATVTATGTLRIWDLLPRGEELIQYAMSEALPPQIKTINKTPNQKKLSQ